MVIGALLVVSAAFAQQSAWHLYEPKGSGIRFTMPGTVYADSQADGNGKTVYRYHADADGIQYTIVFGDVAGKLATEVNALWAKDRSGASVKQILTDTLKASPEEDGTIGVTRFGNMKGFPTMAQIVSHDDGSGSNLMAAFTRRGVVAASVRSPKSPEATQNAFRFIDSIDLSARK